MAKPVPGSFVKYMFIIPGVSDWSEYRYQKLFRLLYGYVQVVSKSSGGHYTYDRGGILTELPYIKTGKNSVIVPPDNLQRLISFFRTKKTSAGDKAPEDCQIKYFIETVQKDPRELVPAFDALFERVRLESGKPLDAALSDLVTQEDYSSKDAGFVLQHAERVCSSSWFQSVMRESPRLGKFFENYQKLKRALS